MDIIKRPEFEDDSYYFVLKSDEQLARVQDMSYLRAKRRSWAELDCTKMSMQDHLGRESFGAGPDIKGSVYTHTIEEKNGMYWKSIMHHVRWHKDLNRRCVVRLADSFVDYQGIGGEVSTSCLNIIHFYKDKVVLFFRASDIENELLVDLVLIRDFFINRVWDKDEDFEIHVIASTAQGVDYKLENLIK